MNTLVNVTIGEITKMKSDENNVRWSYWHDEHFPFCRRRQYRATKIYLALAGSTEMLCHWGALLTLTKPTGTKERPPSSESLQSWITLASVGLQSTDG